MNSPISSPPNLNLLLEWLGNSRRPDLFSPAQRLFREDLESQRSAALERIQTLDPLKDPSDVLRLQGRVSLLSEMLGQNHTDDLTQRVKERWQRQNKNNP